MKGLREFVNAHCSCGGRGPEVEGVCMYCRIWHEVERLQGGEGKMTDRDKLIEELEKAELQLLEAGMHSLARLCAQAITQLKADREEIERAYQVAARFEDECGKLQTERDTLREELKARKKESDIHYAHAKQFAEMVRKLQKQNAELRDLAYINGKEDPRNTWLVLSEDYARQVGDLKEQNAELRAFAWELYGEIERSIGNEPTKEAFEMCQRRVLRTPQPKTLLKDGTLPKSKPGEFRKPKEEPQKHHSWPPEERVKQIAQEVAQDITECHVTPQPKKEECDFGYENEQKFDLSAKKEECPCDSPMSNKTVCDSQMAESEPQCPESGYEECDPPRCGNCGASIPWENMKPDNWAIGPITPVCGKKCRQELEAKRRPKCGGSDE